MNFNEIMQLVKYLNKSDLAEFKMKDKDFELLVRTKNYVKSKIVQGSSMPNIGQMLPSMQMPLAQESTGTIDSQEDADTSSNDDTSGLITIKSPIVGTFYRSPSPDKPPYLKVGDQVNEGSVVCIIEAMKLFNEIESEVSGKIVKMLVEDASPVEYDQELFLVDPKG